MLATIVKEKKECLFYNQYKVDSFPDVQRMDYV